jgi:hypothetical protein
LLGTILLVCRRHERIMPMFDAVQPDGASVPTCRSAGVFPPG